MGSVSGDTPSAPIGLSGFGEAWYRIEIREDSSLWPVYLSAWVELQSDSASDYDLIVRCASCGATPLPGSYNGTGQLDTVKVRWNDDLGQDDDGYIFIEVRWWSGCGGYELVVYGNAAVGSSNCNP